MIDYNLLTIDELLAMADDGIVFVIENGMITGAKNCLNKS